MKLRLVYLQGLQFELTGADPQQEVVQIVVADQQGNLKVKFYDLVDLSGSRNNKNIQLNGQVDNTKIDFNTNIGNDLQLSVIGETVDFDLKLDQDEASWNMSKPLENSLTYESGEFTLTGFDREYTLYSENGLLKLKPGLAQ